MSDYYDSAEGLQISRERALLELKLQWWLVMVGGGGGPTHYPL